MFCIKYESNQKNIVWNLNIHSQADKTITRLVDMNGDGKASEVEMR